MHVCMYVLRICEVHTPWMLRFGMGWGLGVGGVGACSRPCEVAHAMDATLFKFM